MKTQKELLQSQPWSNENAQHQLCQDSGQGHMQSPTSVELLMRLYEFALGSGDNKQPNQDVNENLRDWFKDKWVRFGPDGKIRGDCARGSESEGKPKCLPQSKAHALGKKGRASAAARKRRQDPNANRSGAAINVSTKGKKK